MANSAGAESSLIAQDVRASIVGPCLVIWCHQFSASGSINCVHGRSPRVVPGRRTATVNPGCSGTSVSRGDKYFSER
jgi:hypothetical protein